MTTLHPPATQAPTVSRCGKCGLRTMILDHNRWVCTRDECRWNVQNFPRILPTPSEQNINPDTGKRRWVRHNPNPMPSGPRRVPPCTPVPIDRIIDQVCDDLFVSLEDIHRPIRHAQVVMAREMIVYLGRRHTDMSYPELTPLVGMHSHASTQNAERRCMRKHPEYMHLHWGSTEPCPRMTVGEFVEAIERRLTCPN